MAFGSGNGIITRRCSGFGSGPPPMVMVEDSLERRYRGDADAMAASFIAVDMWGWV